MSTKAQMIQSNVVPPMASSHPNPFFRISPWPPQIAMKEALVLLERRDILEELAPKEKVYENNWIHNEL